PHAAGDLDPQLAHPDDLLGLVVIERNPQVVREPQVVRLPAAHPGGEGAPLALQCPLPGGVKDDPGGCGVAEVPRVQVEGGRVDGVVPGRAGGTGGGFEGEAATPNSSPSAWQVRFLDRNCPCHRYAPIPEIRGPYCTGAVTPSGACPRVTVPQPHRRAII